MAPKVFVLFSFILILMFVRSHAELLSFSDDQITSPFDFINALRGSQKGDKVKGLNELKKYLQHFGYISDSYKIQAHDDNKDNFDDILESAIKTYQVNYNLKDTGTLDADTISNMVLPRCGVPDIINGETWMRSGKGKMRQDHHENKKVHMVSHYKLISGKPKWPSSSPNLTYGFVTNGGQVEFVDIIKRAFNRWVNATSRFTFSRVQNAATANIKIGAYVRSHGDGSPFDGPLGVLAHAFPPRDGRLHFDADERFGDGYIAADQIHLESVAIHEIGHILGLDHSSLQTAIMYAYFRPGEVKVSLTSDDLDGIKALYGN